MATASILNHAQLGGQSSNLSSAAIPAQAKTQATGNATTSTTTTSTDTISANDFLTLLVTELQNQDPTNDTDPNQYVNQLVQINSLEQLVSINQTLSTDLTAPTTGTTTKSVTGSSASAAVISNSNSTTATATPNTANAQSGLVGSISQFVAGQGPTGTLAPPSITSGNISVPPTSNAASRISHALSGSVAH